MIRRAALALVSCLALAGCLEAPEADAPGLLRNPTVPLSVISRGGAQAMEGIWFIRSASPGYAGNGLVEFSTGGTDTPRITLNSMSCAPSGSCTGFDSAYEATPLAQNRWRLVPVSGGDALELWVIWIDDGLTTAALGSPDSEMAFILDRKARGGEDRITAAREVLAFNGYNTSAFTAR